MLLLFFSLSDFSLLQHFLHRELLFSLLFFQLLIYIHQNINEPWDHNILQCIYSSRSNLNYFIQFNETGLQRCDFHDYFQQFSKIVSGFFNLNRSSHQGYFFQNKRFIFPCDENWQLNSRNVLNRKIKRKTWFIDLIDDLLIKIPCWPFWLGNWQICLEKEFLD